jgi:hypothetical protein
MMMGQAPSEKTAAVKSAASRLRAALAAVLVQAEAPELALVHRWLDNWHGVRLLAVGLHRTGYDLDLRQYGDGHWRATFYVTGFAHSILGGSAWEPTAVAGGIARRQGCVEARRAQSVTTARGERGSRLAALLAVVQRQIDVRASPMEEHNQIAGVSPLELLSARPNIHSARCAGMGLTAWANKHSTWHDGRKCTAVDKAQQPRPNSGRGVSQVLSTMNRWTGSVEDGASSVCFYAKLLEQLLRLGQQRARLTSARKPLTAPHHVEHSLGEFSP